MKNYGLFAMLVLLIACGEPKQEQQTQTSTFNMEAAEQVTADVIATALMDSVKSVFGGEQNWKNLPGITWDFFGARKVWWNKKEQWVYAKSNRTDLKVWFSLESEDCRVFMHGEEQLHPDSLQKYREVGESMWNNDKLWLLFPFVWESENLEVVYSGADETTAGENAEVVSLNRLTESEFPHKKYQLYLHPSNYKVLQWNCFSTITDSVPSLVTPWKDYQLIGNLNLALSRGVNQFSSVAVFNGGMEVVDF